MGPSRFVYDGTAYYCDGSDYSQVFACPGQQRCDTGGVLPQYGGSDKVICGASGDFKGIPYAVEGAPCITEQTATCTFDQSAVLLCQRGIWERSETCEEGVKRCERLYDSDPDTECLGDRDTCIGCGDGSSSGGSDGSDGSDGSEDNCVNGSYYSSACDNCVTIDCPYICEDDFGTENHTCWGDEEEARWTCGEVYNDDVIDLRAVCPE